MDLQLSLVDLQSGLRDLYAVREEAETPEEIALLDAEIQRYIATEIRKVDGIADFCAILDRLSHEPRERKGAKELCEIDQEIERLKARRDRFRKILTSIKEMLKFAMQGMTWKEGKPRKLEGVRHTLTLRGNGGVQPVTITDETLLPEEVCDVTIRMSAADWSLIESLVKTEMTEHILDRIKVATVPVIERIRKILETPCNGCEGKGVDALGDTCVECVGVGRMSVAGARLEPRGESVIVS
jgi:uncharacterized small protein (DUF1192 family)